MALFSRTSEKIVALLDIGSSSVGGALVNLSRAGHPSVIKELRVSLVSETVPDPLKLRASMFSALREVVNGLSASGRRPSEAVCVLSSPWHRATMRSSRFSTGEPFVMTPAILEQMVGEEEAKQGRTRFIERKVTSVFLNGYETADPYGKEALHAEALLFTGEAPEDICAGIEELVAPLGLERLVFHSFPFLAFLGIRDLYPDSKNFLIAVISGEISDLVLSSEGTLHEIVSFPVGSSHLLRELNGSGTKRSQALSLLLASGKGKAVLPEGVRVSANQAQQDWSRSFNDAVAATKRIKSLPRFVFLFAEPYCAPWFEETLGKAMSEVSGHKPIVVFLDTALLAEYVTPEACTDPALLFEAFVFDRLFDAGKPLEFLSTKY